MTLVAKRVRFKDHVATPPGLIALEGVVLADLKFEPDDDDVLQVRLNDGRIVFAPTECAEVLP